MSAPGSWIEDAACAGKSTRIFYSSAHNKTAIEIAKSICEKCPVIAQCGEYGRNERFGIWGGMTPRERNKRFRYSGDWVDALGSARRLRALAAIGYGPAHIEHELNEIGYALLTRHGLRWIRESGGRTDAEKAEVIAKVYELLAARGFNTGARAITASKHAYQQGWATPEQWAGIDIDDPFARPRNRLAA